MLFKKAYLALAIVPIMYSCTLPGADNSSVTSTSLATKAEAITYFNCALNNQKLTDDQRNTIKNTVLTQLNLVTEDAWATVEVTFENFAKTYPCNSVASPAPSSGTSATPSASLSPRTSPVPSAALSSPTTEQPGNVPTTSMFNTKEDYIKFLQCVYDVLKGKQGDPASVLLGVEVFSNLNASRFLDDATFLQQKANFEALGVKYKSYCPNPNAQATAAPSGTPTTATTGLTPLKISGGVSEYSCDIEKSLKSGTGAAINLNFVNNSGANVKIYWLDYNGKRTVYKSLLATSQTYSQATFVTHPWVITDQNDKCLKIFVAADSSANNSNINF